MTSHSDKPQRMHRFAYDGLDRVIHERARLGVLTSLVAHPNRVCCSGILRNYVA